MPLASHNFGYMLIEVNPGMVLISLTRTSPFFFRKKSTRPIPSQARVLKVLTARAWIFFTNSGGNFAGISRVFFFFFIYLKKKKYFFYKKPFSVGRKAIGSSFPRK